ncbi:hypothetical protein [Sunxiuqinia sp. sy24]|uniref:hypothetical protein n=1 Tax=Sunxiuqinia sp. sy24 TaxID=3461495 RepID=UPI004046712D
MSNKRKSAISVAENIALILSWIIFSPLFLFLSIRWNKPKLIGRSMLTLIAPLTLLTLVFVSWQGYEYYYYQLKRGSRSEIEAKTGMNFPQYKTIEKRQRTYGSGFNDDFIMNYSVQLDTVDIDHFYQQVKKRTGSKHTGNNDRLYSSWSIDKDKNFSFSHIDYQEHLDLKINTETGVMDITFGSM